MTARQAAVEILKQAGEPVHFREITRRILEQGLWTTAGKTPSATIESRIVTEIKENGAQSVFVRVEPRTFGLRELGALAPAEPSRRVAPKGRHRPKAERRDTLSFSDAAEKVLEQFANKQPMHYREITAKALEMGWLATEGKTPEASMYTSIFMEIKRRKKRGEQPRFAQHGRGFFGLTKWMGKGLAFQIEQHNRRVRQALHAKLLAMDPHGFEVLVSTLLGELGFEDASVTKRSRDGGIDVRGTLVVGDVIQTRMAVQVKKWKRGSNVQAPTVQQLRGSLGAHEQGLIITTSDFSSGAREEASRADAAPVGLMDGKQLVKLLIEHNVGVSRDSFDIIELAEEGEVET